MNTDPQKFGRVVVLMGGMSAEREVSLMSGKRVLEALLEKGVNAFALDVGDDFIEQLLKTQPDRAFIALHGTYGEDGRVQAVLEMLHIPYTGSGVLASALAMDKEKSKGIWETLELPVLSSLITDDVDDDEFKQEFSEFIEEFDFPLCVKPLDNGSSCGVSRVEDETQLAAAYAKAFEYGDILMVEPWIDGREFAVGIVGDEALPPIEIIPKQSFYDYDAKYLVDTTQFICPCDLSAEKQEELKDLALEAYQALGCRHFGRADFMMDREGNFWLLEMNTIPGLTSHSLVPKAAAATGITFPDLMCKVLEFTI